MDATPKGPCKALPRGTLLTRRGVAGLCVLCVSGRLWVTEAGVAVDHMLQAGEHCVVGGKGLVVIEALCDAILVQTRRTVGPPSLQRS
jgi:hypothetical protein